MGLEKSTRAATNKEDYLVDLEPDHDSNLRMEEEVSAFIAV